MKRGYKMLVQFSIAAVRSLVLFPYHSCRLLSLSSLHVVGNNMRHSTNNTSVVAASGLVLSCALQMSDYGGGDHGSGGNQEYQSGLVYQQGQEGQGGGAVADYTSGYAVASDYPGGSRADMGQSGSNEPSGFKLFVGGIPWKYSDEDLREHFSQYGNVISANVR